MPPCRVSLPRALMRLVRLAGVLFTRHVPSASLHHSPLILTVGRRPHTARAVALLVSPLHQPSDDPPLPFVQASHHRLPNPSLHVLQYATTPKICSACSSTHTQACASPEPACQPTASHATSIGPRAQPSIVRSLALGGCVVTRSIADADLHGHRPAVSAPADPSPSLLRPLSLLWVRSLLQTMLTTVCPLAHLCRRRASPPHAHSEFTDLSPYPLYLTCHSCAAVLRDISAGTSYQTVRLVFRPYMQVLPASCTSARHRSSTRVSAAFNLLTHSSQSFGSHPPNSCLHIGYSFTSLGMWTPWSVFQYGAHTCAYSSVLSLLPGQMPTSFRSRYLSAIGLPMYLAFDALAAVRTALPSSTTLPFRLPRGCHPLWLCFPSDLLLSSAMPHGLPSGLFPVQSPLLRESLLISSPAPSNMLKFRAYPCALRIFGSLHSMQRFVFLTPVIVWGA